MVRKKEIPLFVLQAIEPIIKTRGNLYKVVHSPEAILRLEDLDPNSDFYFEIRQSVLEKGNSYVTVEKKPDSGLDNKISTKRVLVNDLATLIKRWSSILEGYENIHSVWDDPILKRNVQEFEEILQILDEDAEVIGFDLGQIEYLNNYLDEKIRALEPFKESNSDFNAEEITDLQEEARAIKMFLTKETKSQIIKRLSVFFAKCKKEGLPIIKTIFIDFATEFTKKLLLNP